MIPPLGPYYEDKLEDLRRIFGPNATLVADGLLVGDRRYPIIDDVIITLDAARLPGPLSTSPLPGGSGPTSSAPYSEDVQRTFSSEWKQYPEMLTEYRTEVTRYFDLLPLGELSEASVVDLGCGIGRWATFVSDQCRSITLVDFSEAIFVARKKMDQRVNAIFVMGDLLDLPFVDDAFDVGYCLGVLHHLPVNALTAMRDLRRLAGRFIVYIYYDLDNRPPHFRLLLKAVTQARKRFCKIESGTIRNILTWSITLLVYKPLCVLGPLVERFTRVGSIPLVEGYRHATLRRLRQDVYDRFFTPIEQRFTKAQIMELSDSFETVTVSDEVPYWHFLCAR